MALEVVYLGLVVKGQLDNPSKVRVPYYRALLSGGTSTGTIKVRIYPGRLVPYLIIACTVIGIGRV